MITLGTENVDREGHKSKHLMSSLTFLEGLNEEDDVFLSQIVIDDETWVDYVTQ